MNCADERRSIDDRPASLDAAIASMVVGHTIGDIGHAVESTVSPAWLLGAARLHRVTASAGPCTSHPMCPTTDGPVGARSWCPAWSSRWSRWS